ncbi:MAG: nicotinamide riboside transporter PnuC [Oscillospiraceae bacterium]|nr:nicotinamide riboside transporter PnuC [Oscillospiraceae bacterium]
MKITNPFATLTRNEWLLWIGSLLLIAAVLLLGGGCDAMVLAALLVGATALIFVSKGEPFGQLLTVVFSLIYGIISYRFAYWGEMITYLGMTAPMALISLAAWLRHPFAEGKTEVQVANLTARHRLLVICTTVAVTAIFYPILSVLGTAQLPLSTVSIATSFCACMLTFLRSPYYALAYAANDIVLILLWYLAAREDAAYLPMILCFVIFFCNDLYGFFNWRRIRRRQAQTASPHQS